jgi:nucleoside-diphosphate-sugar epimerase
MRPSDSYALGKAEAEMQAESFCYSVDGLRIASLRIHQVAPKAECRKDHEDDPKVGKRQLWAWVHPDATARACLQALTEGDWTGHEIFNIVAPDTTQETPTEELARKEFPNGERRHFCRQEAQTAPSSYQGRPVGPQELLHVGEGRKDDQLAAPGDGVAAVLIVMHL